jgi:glycyl-tRNA synthetase beta chain
MEATLLVELLTEELPPKPLRALAEAFCESLRADLEKDGFVAAGAAARAFATPRRLAAQISAVRARSPDLERELQGPPVKAAAPAVEGFARKSGVAVAALERRQSAKGEVFVARVKSAGAALDAMLAAKVEQALRTLPVPKLMRWGAGEAQFVRPVHGLVMLHGTRVIPGAVLGVSASSTTHGHRFLHSGGIALASADEYEARLRDGMVIVDFTARRAEIERQLAAEAQRLGAALGAQAAGFAGLLDEVTALVEHPSVFAGEFGRDFLEVPQECLILTMRQHQKYFPLFDPAGRLLSKFLIVANMRPADPRHIVGGNQRVVRPRLEDARFFYNQDRKTRLEERVPLLARVIYHNKLGSQLERVERIQLLAGRIAREIGADTALTERAAWLAKADLLSGMVGEFPELQGTMGRYYALHDGEPREVADAIEAHYRPRFAGDRIPEGKVACALALADKLETLNGMFSAGGAPTGEKDPFGLRRAALGVIRILAEARLPLALPAHAGAEVYAFVLERLRNLLREQGYAPDEIEAVASQSPERFDLVAARLDGVRTFRKLPEAASLAAANKRIRNILRKSEAAAGALDERLLEEPAERALFDAVRRAEPEARTRLERGDYAATLSLLAALRGVVDAFFDKVMVNAEDPKLRANRHALLRRLDALMNQVADISKLAA